MRKNILITGLPKSGKSTLLKKLIDNIPHKVGLVTSEILEGEDRVGFKIESSTGSKTVLAHVHSQTPYKVSRYFVDVANLNSIIPEVSQFKEEDLLYVDEIGEMQLFSSQFQELTLHYLNAPNTCLATVSQVFEDDFIKNIKDRKDIVTVEISPENREEQGKFVYDLLRKIEKARRYITRPERFKINGSMAELRSEHDLRDLQLTSEGWNCSCDFFHKHKICSHVIAIEELSRKS